MNLLGTYRILNLSDVMTLIYQKSSPCENESWPCISCCFMLVLLMYLNTILILINLYKSVPSDNFLCEMFVALFYLVL